MTEPINDPSYWKSRIDSTLTNGQHLHHSIFRCPDDEWRKIEQSHREALSQFTRANDSILDCGCAYGRLLDLMPKSWQGDYLGIDLSPDFVRMAQETYPSRRFLTSSLLDIPLWINDRYFDYAILISIRPMVSRNLGANAWDKMRRQISRVSRNILYLEYDVNHTPLLEKVQ